ncbi:hypothetical protein [Mariprofundus ferrooxydans]|uniref:hypothetical protein n=1 Tax=Mariprofundus ferrooxydans TaxID=314344 RepID=UPI0003601600|nr:hypothetical protein [Mariprofundus ferrooxydans]
MLLLIALAALIFHGWMFLFLMKLQKGVKQEGNKAKEDRIGFFGFLRTGIPIAMVMVGYQLAFILVQITIALQSAYIAAPLS